MSTIQPSANIPQPLGYQPASDQQMISNPTPAGSNVQPNVASSQNVIPPQHMVLNRRKQPSPMPTHMPHQQPQMGMQQHLPPPALMASQPHVGAMGPTNVHHQPTYMGGAPHNPGAYGSHMPHTPAAAKALQPPMKGDHRLMFATSDDNLMLKQIEQTHFPDGRDFDVKPLLFIVEDIFKRAVPTDIGLAGLDNQVSGEILEERTYNTSFTAVLEALAYLIDRISCEITRKCVNSIDAHSTTITILNMLSSYSWDAKLALALSAFAVSYGEFWLVAQSYTSNQLAKAVAILKQLPEILENTAILKPQFDAIKNLINAMVDISQCVVDFRELPSQYIKTDHEALAAAKAHTPVAVYWTIRSILACASQITGLTLLGREHMVSTTEAWELSSLAHKLNNMHKHLVSLLNNCRKHIEDGKHQDELEQLRRLVETIHIDNMKILTRLFVKRDDVLPLLDGTKRRVGVEPLRRKNVLLLISDLDISHEEVSILEQIYIEGRENSTRHESSPYEVVWVPIVDTPWTEENQRKFNELQSTMPWYTVHHPSVIDRAVNEFIRKDWKFGKKPILVVLDPQGRVACPNALHMMWIWGSLAFPFTTAREEALWREETWRLELLVDGIDPVILNWIAEGRYICLYGGEDIEWIRNFTNAANVVARDAGIKLGMVYVGKSNPKERVRRNNEIITRENLSHCWQDLTSVWYFWVRLESMWHSKIQLHKTPEEDSIMHEIITILSFDGSEGGWVVFSKGSGDITRAKGSQFLHCMQDFPKWQDEAREDFMKALRDYLAGLHTPHHCNRLILPSAAGTIPEKVVCTECTRPMEKFIMYRCCDE